MGRREKPLEPAAGPVQRFAHELRELRAEAGRPTYRALAERVPYSAPTLSAAASGDRLPSLPVLLAYVEACGGDAEEKEKWERRWYEALAADAEPDPEDGESPYPGLARFGPDDRSRFHGRDDLVGELLDLAGRHRVTAVVGASGSGKSSLLRAGLIPALREPARAPDESPESAPPSPPLPLAAIRVLTPGERPAHTHRALFEPAVGVGDTLLVVDQFEEVFSLCHDRAERDRFLGQLLAARDPGSRLRVVLAVRADFYGRCAEHGALADVLRDATLLVGPMPPQRLREAIVRPALAERLVVERALTARMVADVGDEPGGLPLMAHALREVWRRRSGKTLTLSAYEAIGGVRGAIAHTAEDVFGRFGAAEAATARALLLRMVAPGDGTQDTRRTVDRAELPADCGDVLERLVAARLLTVDGSRVDLAHEALISAWPRLFGWVEVGRERLRVHRALTEAALAWVELERDPGALYRGTRLTAAREAFADDRELTGLEREFLAAAIDAHEHGVRTKARAARRTRVLLSALAVLLCLAAVAGVAAWQQNRDSARRDAEAQARRVADIAQTLRISDPRAAMRLSVAAWRIADLPETREAVRTAGVQRERGAASGATVGRSLNTPTVLSGDGRVVVAVDQERVSVWDTRSDRRVATYESGKLGDLVDVSDDGNLAVFHSGRGYLAWDIRRDRAVGRPFGPRDRGDVEGELGPDGRTFVIRLRARDRALVQVWDVPRHRLLARPEAAVSDRGLLPALTPDGRSLLTCLPGGEALEVRTLADGRGHRVTWPRQVRRQACRAGKWTVTPDSRALAFDTPDGIRTWELSPARERPRLDLPGHGEWEADFSADGATAVTTGDGVIALWRTSRPGTPLMRYAVEGDAVDARLDMKDGVVRYLVGGVVRSLDVRDALRGDRLREPLERAAFSQDGRSLAAAQRRGGTTVFQLRDARDGAVTSSLSGRTCAQCRPGLFAFSRDGGTLAYTAESDGGTELRRWSVDRRRETARAVIPSYVASLLVPDGGGPVVTSGTPAGHRDNDRHYVDAWSVGERIQTRQLHRRAGDEPSALSPNGRTVLARNGERIAIGSGASTRVLRGEISITAVAFSPDGRHLAVAGGNGRLTLWNASGTRRLGVLAESAAGPGTGATPVLAFSPDGRHLAVGREDGTVRLWETDTPRLSGATYPGAEGPVLALGFTRDELRVTTPRTPVRALPLSPERAADRACERAGGGLDRDEWRTYLPTLEYRRTC